MTKSKVCAVLLVVLFSITARAQIVVGAKTGVNINQFQQPGTTFGVTLGGYASYQPLSFLVVKVEPQYSLEGGGRPDYGRNYTSISSNVVSIAYLNPSIRFHNIQLPLMAELSLPEFSEEVIKPKLLAGISYGLMMSAFETATKRFQLKESPDLGSSYSFTDVSYQKENVTDNYKRNQWSLISGIGLDFKSGTRTFSFDVRYRYGISNLNLLRFASPGGSDNLGTTGAPGTGGKLFSSSVSLNFSVSLFNF